MNSFEYAAPDTLEEAVSLLAETWGQTELLAGGTDLVTSLKQGITSPSRLVSLKNLKDLKEIEATPDTLRVGATVTLAQLADHPAVRRHFPALLTAIEGVGSPQIIHAGTVGGDLCQRPRCWYFRNGFGLLALQNNTSLPRQGDNRYHAIFGNDGPAAFVSPSSLGPALVALNATLTIAQPKNKTRTLPAREFFHTPKTNQERPTTLQPNEILTQIQVPIQGLKNATCEIRHRQGLDWPYVTASVAFALNAGQAARASIVLGHVAPVPWPAPAAAAALNGAPVNETTAAQCGQAATQGAKPLSRNAYKIQLVKTAVQRAILAAANLAGV